MTHSAWLSCVCRRMSMLVLPLALIAVAVPGCAPDIEQDPPPQTRVSTIFDSETSVIPLPNNAALESDGTLPAQEGAGNDTAQGDFLSYLDSLHGFLRATPLEVPFDGELDPSTATPENVRLYRIPQNGGASDAVRLDVDDVTVRSQEFEVAAEGGGTRTVQGSMLTIVPAEPLERDTRYGYVVTDDVQSADGRSTVASQPMFFAGSKEPLVDDNGEKTIESIPSDDLAKQLDGLRKLTRPAFETAEQNGIGRKDVVAAVVWTTFEDTMAEFDPNAGNIPFPNDFLRNQQTGEVNLPVPDEPSQLEQQLFGELNTRTGFSTVAPGWLEFAGPVNTETIGSDTFFSLSFRTSPQGVYEEGRFTTRYLSESDHLIFEPTIPWRADSSLDPAQEDPSVNIWGVTDGLESPDNGWAVKPSPITVLLRSEWPLVTNCEQTPNQSQGVTTFDGCESTVSVLSADQAEQLEVARLQYNQLLVAVGLGAFPGLPDDLSRDDIIAAWFAHPSNPLQTSQSLRAQALDELGSDPSATFANGSNCMGGGGGKCETDPSGLSNVQIAQRAAEFDTVAYLQQDGTLDTENSTSTAIGLSVYVPAQTGDCSSVSEFPVAIVQHGLGSWRQAMEPVVNALAAECIASVSMDFVGHGGRTPNTSDLHPDSKPGESGASFISPDLVRTKNHFLQSFVDLSVLAELIASDGLEGAIDNSQGTNYFDYGMGVDTKIGYVGTSLGGIIGTSFTTIDDEATVGAFNVAGGKLSRILSEGTLGDDIIMALREADIEAGTFDEVQALTFIQWIAEPVDPLAFAPFTVDNPARELSVDNDGNIVKGMSLPENEVMLQMASGDTIVPNGATEVLANALGDTVDLQNTTFDAGHGFLLESSGADSAADCGRRQVAAWISSGLGIDGSTEATLPQQLYAGNCVSQ